MELTFSCIQVGVLVLIIAISCFAYYFGIAHSRLHDKFDVSVGFRLTL